MEKGDAKTIRAVKREDARAVRLGRIIDRTYELARAIEIASAGYADAGLFTTFDTMRSASRPVREAIGILERARDLAAARR